MCDYMFTCDVTPRPSSNRDRLEVELLGADVATERPRVRAELGLFAVEGEFLVDTDESAGHVRLVELTISTWGAEITPTALRELQLSRFIQAAKGEIVRKADEFLAVTDADEHLDEAVRGAIEKKLRARIKAMSRKPMSGGAQGRGAAFYRRIALDLIELVESGKPTPGGVLETLARIESDRLRLPDVPVQTLRTWLRVAREKQFLAPGERGRLLAIAGPRLYEMDGAE
jgi:hypothetical protein